MPDRGKLWYLPVETDFLCNCRKVSRENVLLFSEYIMSVEVIHKKVYSMGLVEGGEYRHPKNRLDYMEIIFNSKVLQSIFIILLSIYFAITYGIIINSSF